MKEIILQTWRHTLVAFCLQLIIMFIFKETLSQQLELFGQCLIFSVLWFVINYGFEIYQKGQGGSNTPQDMLFDCLAAALGGLLGVLISQIF